MSFYGCFPNFGFERKTKQTIIRSGANIIPAAPPKSTLLPARYHIQNGRLSKIYEHIARYATPSSLEILYPEYNRTHPWRKNFQLIRRTNSVCTLSLAPLNNGATAGAIAAFSSAGMSMKPKSNKEFPIIILPSKELDRPILQIKVGLKKNLYNAKKHSSMVYILVST